MNQTSQTQFRAKSGAPVAFKGDIVMKAIGCASLSGKVQARMAGGEKENWFCVPAGAGTAGADCELADGCAAQQLILPPQWQQARTGRWAHDDSVCAGRKGVPASKTLQKMANAVFMP